MNIRLSIIIPFYNVEQYIAQCLDSVYNQDIPEEEYEVICVNDASPDNSRDIVKEYQKKHKNLILVEHEVNKKLGAARNTGRIVAKGKYIWNVDSDDMIAPNCLKEMLTICEENELDVLMFGVSEFSMNKLHAVCYTFPKSRVQSGCDWLKQYGAKCSGWISPVWMLLLNRDFLNRNSIYSPEINMSEDVPYSYAAIVSSKRMQSIDFANYLYRINEISIGHSQKKCPSVNSSYESCFIAARDIFAIRKIISPTFKEIDDYIRGVGMHCFLFYKEYFRKMNKDQQNLFIEKCRKNFWKNLFVFRSVSNSEKITYLKFLLTGVV